MAQAQNEYIDISPDEPVEAYAPTDESLSREFDNLTEDERRRKISDLLNEVKALWSTLEKNNLIKKILNAVKCHNEMDKCSVTPFSGIPNNKPKYYWWHINMEYDDPESGCLIGKQLVEGQKLSAEFSDSGKNTVMALCQLQRLFRILTKVKVCYEVSVDTGIGIDTVLALYRVEGDMNLPASLDSLFRGIPTGVSKANSSLGYRPHLHSMVMYFSEKKYNDLP